MSDKFYNFTPHTLNLYDNDDKCILQLPSDGCIRLSSSKQKRIEEHSEKYKMEIYSEPSFETFYGLPEDWNDKKLKYPDEYRNIIVSKIVADWMKNEVYTGNEILDQNGILNVFYPDTGPESAIRKDGNIIGVKRLCWSWGPKPRELEEECQEIKEDVLNFLMAACQYG